MYFTDIFPLISSVFVFILALIVFFENIKSRINLTFFLHALAITVWLFGTFMMFISRSETDLVIFWDKIVYMGVVFIPVFMYHFVLAYTDKPRDFLLYFGYFLSFGFLFSIPTDLFVSDVFVYQWGAHTKAQLLHHFFMLYFVSYVIIWFIKIFKYYKTIKIATVRLKAKYIIFSFLVLFTIGPIAYLPAYGVSIYPFAYISGLFFVVILSYAILRYRLMDIRIVTRRVFIYFFIGVFTYGFFYFLIWFYNCVFGSVFSVGAYVTGLVTVPIFLFLFYSLNRFLRVFANKHLFVSLYNYQDTINKLTDKLNHYINLDKLIDLIVDTIKKTMQLNRAGVLLVNNQKTVTYYKIAKVIGFNKQNGISLVQDNFLTKYLQDSQKPLVRDELELLTRDAQSIHEQQSFKKLHKYMKKIEASLCLPLLSQKKLIGIIVLGSKKSGDAYTVEDLNLLNVLSKQAGIAVENAKLYKEVQKKGLMVESQKKELSARNQEIQEQKEELSNLNEQLKEKVSYQDKDIKDKSRYLEELLNMKSDFLRVVNHQLNTPVSIIRGSCSMIAEDKSYTERGLESINAGITRIYDTMSDFWRAYQIEGQKMDLNLDLVNVEDIIEQQVREKKEMDVLEKRKLTLQVKKTERMSGGIPQAYCDKKNLVHVISNLLDNAVFYTEKGGITIFYDRVHRFDGEYLKISVSDTGVGIPEEDRDHIYKKFGRGKNAQLVHPDGSGLGLYIAKKIIEDTGGEFVLEKTKLGKGSTFSFTLPLFDINNTVSKKKKIKREKKYKEFLKARESNYRFSKVDNSKPTVLLLEDEKYLIEMYHDYLEKHNYDFYNTSNIDEAMVLVKTVKPDVILLDIIIPKEDEGGMVDIVAEQGWEFLRAIKENSNYKNIPVLVFTNLNSDEDREKAEKLGAAKFLFKAQVMPKDVIKVIDEVLGV